MRTAHLPIVHLLMTTTRCQYQYGVLRWTGLNRTSVMTTRCQQHGEGTRSMVRCLGQGVSYHLTYPMMHVMYLQSQFWKWFLDRKKTTLFLTFLFRNISGEVFTAEILLHSFAWNTKFPWIHISCQSNTILAERKETLNVSSAAGNKYHMGSN